MNCQYVREYYKVPACIGRRVKIDGKTGIIAEDRGNYIGVNLDADKPSAIHNYHPTDGVEYLNMGKVRKLTRSQQNYRDYLRADCGHTFAEWMLFKSAQRCQSATSLMNEYKPTPEEELAHRRADNDREGQKDIIAALAEIEGAMHKSAGPSGSLCCDGLVGSLSREEVLTLKIAEHDLHRTAMIAAVRKLLHGARKAGTSQHQCLILRVHLEELCQRADAAEEVKWPNLRRTNTEK